MPRPATSKRPAARGGSDSATGRATACRAGASTTRSCATTPCASTRSTCRPATTTCRTARRRSPSASSRVMPDARRGDVRPRRLRQEPAGHARGRGGRAMKRDGAFGCHRRARAARRGRDRRAGSRCARRRACGRCRRARVHDGARCRHRDRRRGRRRRGAARKCVDRRGEPLNATFTNGWNLHDRRAAARDPAVLCARRSSTAEDKRFFEHRGADWSARLSAVWTNVQERPRRARREHDQRAGRAACCTRGRAASGAAGSKAGKRASSSGGSRRTRSSSSILNQVPYASNRRGVRQAASYYFARDRRHAQQEGNARARRARARADALRS